MVCWNVAGIFMRKVDNLVRISKGQYLMYSSLCSPIEGIDVAYVGFVEIVLEYSCQDI